jgi:hypothetical protein
MAVSHSRFTVSYQLSAFKTLRIKARIMVLDKPIKGHFGDNLFFKLKADR